MAEDIQRLLHELEIQDNYGNLQAFSPLSESGLIKLCAEALSLSKHADFVAIMNEYRLLEKEIAKKWVPRALALVESQLCSLHHATLRLKVENHGALSKRQTTSRQPEALLDFNSELALCAKKSVIKNVEKYITRVIRKFVKVYITDKTKHSYWVKRLETRKAAVLEDLWSDEEMEQRVARFLLPYWHHCEKFGGGTGSKERQTNNLRGWMRSNAANIHSALLYAMTIEVYPELQKMIHYLLKGSATDTEDDDTDDTDEVEVAGESV